MEELVEEIKNGNKNLYEKVVDLMKNQLYSTAFAKLNNKDLAEDAVQETFLKAYNKLDQLKEPKYFKTWITKILINECNDINKDRKNEKVAINRLKESMKENTKSFDIEEKVEFEKNDLLKDLTEKEREIFKLYYEENYTTSEISKHLNMNENTVKSFLFRTRKKLRVIKVSRFFIFILAFIVVTSGITFGGRFINGLKEKLIMFQITSNKGIADARDYIENVDTEFVYSNNIGIKVDSVAIDDKILYLSYLLDTKDDINDIELEKYSIKDELGNLLAVGIENDIDNNYTSDYSSCGVSYSTKPEKLESSIWSYSTVFQVVYNKDYPISHKIYVDIEEISVLTDKDRKTISGNWNFEVDIPEKFRNRTSETYKYKENHKIKSINTSLNDLSFEVEIVFNENIDSEVMTLNNLILEDSNEELINCYSKVIGKNRVKYICDISKHSEASDKLRLYVKYNKGSDKCVNIDLEK